MENLNNVTKRRILARFVECLVADGFAIDWIFAKNLNWFDYEQLVKDIHKTERGSQMEMEEDELFTV